MWGKDKEWDAEIVEQVPDQYIAWRSTSGDAPNNGAVRFESLGPDRTRVNLTMEYDPQGVIENIGDKLGVMSGRVETTIKQFRDFIEKRPGETGAWRGEVHGGRKTS